MKVSSRHRAGGLSHQTLLGILFLFLLWLGALRSFASSSSSPPSIPSQSLSYQDPSPPFSEDPLPSSEDWSSRHHHDFYTSRYLPPPQVLLQDSVLQFQMHNCLKGRDGSKLGLRDAGIRWVAQQRASASTGNLLRINPDAHIVLMCNNVSPAKSASRDPRVNGKRLVATTQGITDYYCLGSIKIEQLKCRRYLAEKMGCEYDDLGIQPPQYLIGDKTECERLVKDGKDKDRPWLMKPSESQRGRGILYFQNTASLVKEMENLGGCTGSGGQALKRKNNASPGNPALANYLVQQYVTKPALLDVKYKFDVRSWLLVASVDPLIMFYHDGFVRVAKTPYDESSTDRFAHITNLKGSEDNSGDTARRGDYLRSFRDASEELHKRFGLPADFMTNEFRKKISRAQVFAAISQFIRDPPVDLKDKRKGFYHLFACDSVVDRDGGVHLLECNAFPAESQQNQVDGTMIWREMVALVLNLHLEPWKLMDDPKKPDWPSAAVPPVEFQKRGVWKSGAKVLGGDKFRAGKYAFGGWHLAYNELETPMEKYDACGLRPDPADETFKIEEPKRPKEEVDLLALDEQNLDVVIDANELAAGEEAEAEEQVVIPPVETVADEENARLATMSEVDDDETDVGGDDSGGEDADDEEAR